MNRKPKARAQVVACINWDWAVIALLIALLALVIAGQVWVADTGKGVMVTEDADTALAAAVCSWQDPGIPWDAVAVNWESEKRRWP